MKDDIIKLNKTIECLGKILESLTKNIKLKQERGKSVNNVDTTSSEKVIIKLSNILKRLGKLLEQRIK
ncbi:MAG: hypothetical protein ACO2O4_05090 [Minisyncoccia bacterium]|jgi:hypothetical protein